MCETSHLHFANAYEHAPREFRLQIDAAVSFYRKQDNLLGVVSLHGLAKADDYTSLNIALRPSSFSMPEFSAAVATFQSIKLCVLLVRANNVFPPVAALELLASTHGEVEIIRASAADFSFECRPQDWILERARAQSARCHTCERRDTCATAAAIMHFVPLAKVRAAS